MKVLCIRSIYPEDECGCGPNTYSFVFTNNHCYYVEDWHDWEEGNGINSKDIEVDDELYRFCFEEVYDYFSNIDPDDEWDEYDEFVFEAGTIEIADSDFYSLNIIKESACINFVKENVIPDTLFNVSEENSTIRDCLTYLTYDFDSLFSFGECDEMEDKQILAERIRFHMNDKK